MINSDSIILVTGYSGQLGSDCVNTLISKGYYHVIGIDSSTLDITNEKLVKEYIKKIRPNIVIHCAAFTAVDKAEEMFDYVYKVNALGPKYIAEACKEVNATMFFFSTDYVFDGKGKIPFETYDKKGGLSVYGKTKSLGEDFVLNTLEKHFIIRISWVFGKNGKNFVKTMLNLSKAKKELNVVSDQIGSPTYTIDLANLICDMIETDKFGIYHATNEGFCSWYEFAEEIFKIYNIDIKLNSITTKDYLSLNPNQAIRPLNSRLSKKSLDDNGFSHLPNWKNAIFRYFKETKGEY